MSFSQKRERGPWKSYYFTNLWWKNCTSLLLLLVEAQSIDWPDLSEGRLGHGVQFYDQEEGLSSRRKKAKVEEEEGETR